MAVADDERAADLQRNQAATQQQRLTSQEETKTETIIIGKKSYSSRCCMDLGGTQFFLLGLGAASTFGSKLVSRRREEDYYHDETAPVGTASTFRSKLVSRRREEDYYHDEKAPVLHQLPCCCCALLLPR
jgi:hypothetical protein